MVQRNVVLPAEAGSSHALMSHTLTRRAVGVNIGTGGPPLPCYK